MNRIERTRVALVLALATVIAVIAASDPPSIASTPALHEESFIDEDTGFAFSVQLDQAASDAGHWTFRVNGASYSGNAGAAVAVHSTTSVVIHYEGTAMLRRLGPGGTTSDRPIRLQAQVDPSHHTAEAKLWDAGSQFHIVAKAPNLGGLETTMTAVERAITANDPSALFPLLNAQATAAYGATGFATAWNSQSPTLGRVTALRRTATGSAQSTAAGFWFVSVDYSADIVTPAGVGSAVFTAFFIHESRGWKLWTTVRR